MGSEMCIRDRSKTLGHRILNILILIFSVILVLEALAVVYVLFEANRLEKRENELRGITHQHMSMVFVPSESLSIFY